MKTILFPSSYFNGKKVDEDLQKEYEAVVETGLFDIRIFNYDKWFNEKKLLLSGCENENFTGDIVSAVYRGWMMKPEQYEAFYKELLAKGIRLVTMPKQYAHFHVFPNVYPDLCEDTARLVTYPLHKQLPIVELHKQFQRFMIKDYVKSVKGTDFPKYFDQNTTQEELNRWMEVFYKYRGDLLTGGICVKEYLDLKKYNQHTNEYRVFYMNHEIATICRNSLQNQITAEPPQELLKKYKNLSSPYYTIDYAELEDGTWRIIEAGDGSVSGLSDGQDYVSYYRCLYDCFQ